MRNTRTKEELDVQSMLEFIKQIQLSWWEHLQRTNTTKPVKQVWETKIQKRKKIDGQKRHEIAQSGRYSKTWQEIRKSGANLHTNRKYILDIL